jgi:hypothetical protein
MSRICLQRIDRIPIQIAMENLSGHKTGYKPQKRRSKKKKAGEQGRHNFGHSPENIAPNEIAQELATVLPVSELDGGQCRTRTCDLLLVSRKDTISLNCWQLLLMSKNQCFIASRYAFSLLSLGANYCLGSPVFSPV